MTVKTDTKRRSFLKGIAALPVVTIAGFQSVAQAAMVPADNPTAAAVKYTEHSTQDGKTCANCMLYQGGDKPAGGCPIFPGFEVAAAGWCASWAAKP